MANLNLQPPLVPKNGATLKVLGIDRISTRNQDPQSNADQQALLREWINNRFNGPIDWHVITGQGSGESLDRQQVRDAEDYVATETFDVVIMEDLGRHLRRAQAVDFCEQCEDCNTRLIAINDHIDTGTEWRLHAFFAAIKHESSNKDTSDRIKRSLRSRFLIGLVVQSVIFGYVKPADAKSDSDLTKDPVAELIYDEWFNKLENGASYSEVADWLNRLGVPTGPSCRSDKWDCKMVARVTHNPFLKGVRERNNRKSKRVNKSGKYISVKASPQEKLERKCPHLAFIEPARYDRVIALLKERNSGCRPGRPGGVDPRAGRPKKRTIWPGQHLDCGICGRCLRYGGHGQNDHLLCRGAYEYKCWNGITVDGPLAARKMTAAVFTALEELQDFDAVFHDAVEDEMRLLLSSQAERLSSVQKREAQVTRELENLLAFIRQGKSSPTLRQDFDCLEAERDRLVREREAIENEPEASVTLPTLDELKQLARDAMARHADQPYEFGRIMKKLIARIEVRPYRLCDGGHVVLRAHFRLSLANFLPAVLQAGALENVVSRDLVVDLFDPPQREAFRSQVVELRRAGVKEKQIAAQLGLTVTAVQKAAALDRMMAQRGIHDPYVPLSAPPDDAGKLRRHRHPRYRFEPLSGSAGA